MQVAAMFNLNYVRLLPRNLAATTSPQLMVTS